MVAIIFFSATFLLAVAQVQLPTVQEDEAAAGPGPNVRNPSIRSRPTLASASERAASSRIARNPQPAAAAAVADEDGAGLRPSSCPANSPSCFVVSSYWPYKSCQESCSAEVCNRGWGAWQSEEICCSPGVAFTEGCTSRPDECWVVENWNVKTCIRDDRKCLQGFGVWASKETCCAPGAAFTEGCSQLELSPEPCWVVDTYFPSRLCRQSNTLCDKPEAGVQAFRTEQECCSPGNAFSEGCSRPPQVPCWVKKEEWPNRTCTMSDDIALCNRGWGVYTSKDVCCSPNVAFQEGCTPELNTILASSGP